MSWRRIGNTSSDEWVAGIASYVRSNFRAQRRHGDAGRRRAGAAPTCQSQEPWTIPELEASLPRLLDAQQWKLTASHGADTAAGAATLRGWSSGAPQAPDMWFAVELAQPVVVTEVQFDSNMASGGPRRTWRPRRTGRARRHLPASAPVIGYPRGYSVQVSADGTTWSKPVATGKGEGLHTTIPFAPTRAKFVRITQTDAVADAPAWSIRNLRIYEAPAARAGSR